MTKFNVGDYAVVQNYGDGEYSSWGGKIVKITNPKTPAASYIEGVSLFGPISDLMDGDEKLLFVAKELSPLPAGTRVRVTNQSQYKHLEGVIHSYDAHFGMYKITFDGNTKPSGGYWTCGAFEPIQKVDVNPEVEVSEREQALAEAVELAMMVFDTYADQHFAKETPEAWMKGITNVGLATMMQNALETD